MSLGGKATAGDAWSAATARQAARPSGYFEPSSCWPLSIRHRGDGAAVGGPSVQRATSWATGIRSTASNQRQRRPEHGHPAGRVARDRHPRGSSRVRGRGDGEKGKGGTGRPRYSRWFSHHATRCSRPAPPSGRSPDGGSPRWATEFTGETALQPGEHHALRSSHRSASPPNAATVDDVLVPAEAGQQTGSGEVDTRRGGHPRRAPQRRPQSLRQPVRRRPGPDRAPQRGPDRLLVGSLHHRPRPQPRASVRRRDQARAPPHCQAARGTRSRPAAWFSS